MRETDLASAAPDFTDLLESIKELIEEYDRAIPAAGAPCETES
ncbi:hypothetical protein [Actinomadura parmotrematis]|nr:hypothetical protein [Actinomadura parmotrematis]